MAKTAQSAHALTDHEQIRRWAQQRGAQPACVRGTGDGEDVGMIRLDFPGYRGADSLESISWDEWFQKFDENNLALLVQDETARGQMSNFNKLVSRDTAEERSGMQEIGRRRPQGRGKRSSRRSKRGRVSGRRARATTASHRRSEAGTSSRRSGRRAGKISRSTHSRSSQTRSTRARRRRSSAAVRAFNRTTRSAGKRSKRSVRESSRRRAA